MMNIYRHTLSVLALLVSTLVSYGSVVVTNVPDGYNYIFSFYMSIMFEEIELSHNSDEQINKEISDPAIINLITKSCGISESELVNIKIVIDTENADFDIYGKYDKERVDQILDEYSIKSKDDLKRTIKTLSATNANPESITALNSKTLKEYADVIRVDRILKQAINEYENIRKSGHTRAYAIASLQSTNQVADIQDHDLRVLVEKEPDFPLFWPYIKRSGIFTNETGEAYRQVVYVVVDGEIAHKYMIDLNMDGSYRCGIMGSGITTDAKDIDPQYTNLIHKIEVAVSEEMIQEGSTNQWGSCRRFWELKKEKLKENGIEWKSPADLNPNICFD